MLPVRFLRALFFHPPLQVWQAFPTKGVIGSAVFAKVIEPLECFVECRLMTLIDPPHDEMRFTHRLEPAVFETVDLPVHRIPHKVFKRLGTFPNRKIDDRILGTRMPQISCVVTVAGKPPDKAGATLADSIDPVEVTGEALHMRALDFETRFGNIELGEVQELYSAAIFDASARALRFLA